MRYCCWVIRSCPTPCDPMNCSTPGFAVLYHLLYFAQTHVHWVSDAIQPCPLLPLSSCPLSLFQWIGSSCQVVKVLELQHQSFQWVFSVDIKSINPKRSPCCPRDSQESSPATQFKTIKSSVLSLLYFQHSHPYMTTGKTIFLTIQTFVGKVMSLLFNMLSRFVIAFLPRSIF